MSDKPSDELDTVIDNFKNELRALIRDDSSTSTRPTDDSSTSTRPTRPNNNFAASNSTSNRFSWNPLSSSSSPASRKPSSTAVQQKLNDLYQPYSAPKFGESSKGKTSYRAKRQSTAQIPSTPMFKDVILLKSVEEDSIVKKADRDEYFDLGLLKVGVEFNKNLTECKINEVIEKNFKTFPEIADFTWMYECGSKKLIPLSSMDGVKFSQIYNQKKLIYVKPSATLGLPTKKRRRFSSGENTPFVADKGVGILEASNSDNDDNDIDLKEALERSRIDFERQTAFDNTTVNASGSAEDHASSNKPTLSSTKDVLEFVASKNLTETNARSLIIRRQDPLGSAFDCMDKSTFAAEKRIHVIFADDIEGICREGVDNGGLKREGFSLFLRGMVNHRVFVGYPLYICYDADALREKKYYYFGVILGKTMLEGGPSPAIFHENFYFLLLKNKQQIKKDVECLPKTIAEEVKKIQAADSETALFDSISEQTLVNVGITYPLTCDRKETLISDIMDYYLVNCLHTPMEQIRDGMNVNGLYDQIVAHPNLFRNEFVASDSKVTPQDIHGILSVVRSEKGTSNHIVESKAFAFWMSFVDDCGEGLVEVTPEGNSVLDRKKEVKYNDGTVTPLQPSTDEEVATRGWMKIDCSDILMFFTGASSIPILGFKDPPTLEFLLGPTKKHNLMPEANTCGPVLFLPVANTSYEVFVAKFVYAVHFCKEFHKM